VDSNSVPTSTTPEVIIPKINVEIPVVYGQTSINESVIEDALEDGVVHYPTTALPGQNGNAAFFGHSSNNIFNKGRYKFAFVLLHTLEPGDTFYLTRDQKTYVYKVTSKKVVDPSEVGVLDPIPGKTATATLITCDPPGTSLKRLIIVGDQISPDPAGNTASATPVASQQQTPTNLPGNGPTLFSRFIKSVAGRTTAIGVIVLALFAVVRWMNKPRLRLG
jgi:LPXTG-site transpeptidase (sortase) family protein